MSRANSPARFSGKVYLVTGATSGIGRSTVLELVRQGASVAFTGRRENLGKELEAAAQDIARTHPNKPRALFIRADHTQDADNKNAVDATLRAFSRLDGAFNNAGVEATGPITEVTPESYRHVFDVNVLGVLLSLKHQIPAILRTAGKGAIVNTSSIAGHIGMANVSVYIASKHAVEGITKSVALEYAKQGIRVNAVAPAAIETPMFDRFTGGQPANQDYMASLHPIGRTGKPEEITHPVLFLLSDEASFITGHSLVVDGAFIAQ
jgi:NAD(P)-dependent dehydrogenase (short-subunit alcohol dehydrogenase family)